MVISRCSFSRRSRASPDTAQLVDDTIFATASQPTTFSFLRQTKWPTRTSTERSAELTTERRSSMTHESPAHWLLEASRGVVSCSAAASRHGGLVALTTRESIDRTRTDAAAAAAQYMASLCIPCQYRGRARNLMRLPYRLRQM